MARLQFAKQDDTVWDQPAGLPVNFGMRAYDPGHGNDADGQPIGHSGLGDACSGDWSWKPYRDMQIGDNFREFTGERPVLGRHPYGCEQAQGGARATTRVTPEGRISQTTYLKAAPKTGSMKIPTKEKPSLGQEAMAPTWDLINDNPKAKRKVKRVSKKGASRAAVV